MNVVINYASDEDAANEVVRSITAAGGIAIAIKGDVSKSDQFAHLFDQAELRFGGLDMLVNNAGQMSPMLIADVDEEKFDRLFAINVRGVLNGCKLAAKRLREGGRPRVAAVRSGLPAQLLRWLDDWTVPSRAVPCRHGALLGRDRS